MTLAPLATEHSPEARSSLTVWVIFTGRPASAARLATAPSIG